MKKSNLLVSAAIAATILGSQAALADNHEKKKEEAGKNGCQGKNTCKGEKVTTTKEATKETTTAVKDGSNGCGANGCQDHKKDEKKK